MNNKPIVLVIENSIDVTGALKSITRAANDLKKFYSFQFVIPKYSKGKSWIESNGFSVIHELPMRELSKRMSSIVFYFPFLLINAIRLRSILKKNKVTAIHVNDLYNLLPVAIRLMGIQTPYICHIRFLPDRFPAWIFNSWLKLHLRFAEKIIVVSKSVERMIPSHPKILVIHNELPIEEHIKETEKVPSNKLVQTFLYLSNFMDGKGQAFALKAFAKAQLDLPEWKLRFVGGDMGLKKNKEYRNKLVEEASKLGIDKKIEWEEFSNDVEREYKQADIVLNFSESESFSMTCAEALYFGRPLIATNCGGPAEIIEHEVTGLLVPNRNVDAMAKAMMELAVDKNKRNALGLAARHSVREKFGVEKTSYLLKEIYDLLIKK
jgi:L-malate glycosyltransferase